jgi:hypothetical protein
MLTERISRKRPLCSGLFFCLKHFHLDWAGAVIVDELVAVWLSL